MQRVLLALGMWVVNMVCHADTIGNYMHIRNQLPQMAVKAEPQAQAWVRSARNILATTDETILETIVIMNQMMGKGGKKMFCIPQGTQINAKHMDEIIEKAYVQLPEPESEKNKRSLSEVAILGMIDTYPCHASPAMAGHTNDSSEQQMVFAGQQGRSQS